MVFAARQLVVICTLCNPATGNETAALAMGSEYTTMFMLAPMWSVTKPICGRRSGSSPELPHTKPCNKGLTHSRTKYRSGSQQ